jgi:hypothetical protein
MRDVKVKMPRVHLLTRSIVANGQTSYVLLSCYLPLRIVFLLHAFIVLAEGI